MSHVEDYPALSHHDIDNAWAYYKLHQAEIAANRKQRVLGLGLPEELSQDVNKENRWRTLPAERLAFLLPKAPRVGGLTALRWRRGWRGGRQGFPAGS